VSGLLLGAVAYDPKVVTIWHGFRRWLGGRGLDLDYVLYSDYERQTEDLVGGRLDVAWSSPLAWVRARRLATARGVDVSAVAMRDTDRDLTSVVVVAATSPVRAVADLAGRVVATGAADSPQATLLPLSLLRSHGLEPGRDVELRRFDVGVGLHGDHVGGEREAARALVAGQVDAACLSDANHLAFVWENVLPPGSTRVVAQTAPYDHCVMAVGPTAQVPAATSEAVARLVELLLAMSYDDDTARPLLDLEGLKAWCPGRTTGFGLLEQAVDEVGFYGPDGAIGAAGPRP
jgi:ABC-type phosphate/phosphonate transport system substrate-binding protein